MKAVAAMALGMFVSSLPARSPAEAAPTPGQLATVAGSAQPNIILILCDNLGYGDLGCYGSSLHRTPCVDRLAREGMRFTDFYVSSGVCTPSRASLMTGCYPRRVSLQCSESGGAVLQPVASKGLHPNEQTIAEVLKTVGYSTAIVGKWHLGDQPPFLPTRQGFDRYFGIPYSDDMTARPTAAWPPLPLMADERVVEAPADRTTLTQRYTEKAIQWITAARNERFFLYLAHAMPGSTLTPFASERFRGRSANGAYGDSVEEIDWSTGEILDALERLQLADKTLVIWMSDNGAPRRNPPQGSNQPLRGWGYTTAEGGMRVPMIARWPTQIPPGTVCREMATSMDLLPTLAHFAGAGGPRQPIDGKDIGPLLTGSSNSRSPHEALFYYHIDQLQAVRSGRWKLYLPIEARRRAGATRQKPAELALYDLQTDLAETKNQAAVHPETVSKLMALADQARRELGDEEQAGSGQRPAGHVEHPTPRVLTPDTRP